MRTKMLVVIFAGVLMGCANKTASPTKLYNPSFYTLVSSGSKLQSDSATALILATIATIKHRLVADFDEGISSPDRNALHLIIENEYGGKLAACIALVGKTDSSFAKKYVLEDDCSHYNIDQVLLYLTNMERDALKIQIENKP